MSDDGRLLPEAWSVRRSAAMKRQIPEVGLALAVAAAALPWLGCWGMSHWLETVDLSGYEFSSVRIVGDEGQVEIGAGEEARLDADIRYSGDDPPVIDIAVEGGELVVDVDCAGFLSACRSDLSLVLPAETPLVVSTESGPIYVTNMAAAAELDTIGGAVNVDGHDGDLWIAGGSGSINLYGITAETVDVSTGSGTVEATALEVAGIWADTEAGTVNVETITPPETVVIATDTGSVGVRVPVTDASYDLRLSTDAGSFSTTGIEDDDASWRVIDITTATGSISVVGF